MPRFLLEIHSPTHVRITAAVLFILRFLRQHVSIDWVVCAMGEARWKLVVDQDGMTIASDKFRLTAGSEAVGGDLALADKAFEAIESGRMEEIVAELESMTQRSYGQFCGLSRALEL